MCDVISAFPAVQSDSRSCYSCAQHCTSVHECSVSASAASLYCTDFQSAAAPRRAQPRLLQYI